MAGIREDFLGEGDLYIDIFDPDTGEWTGFEVMGDADQLAIKSETEKKENFSKGRDTYGQVLTSVVLPKPSTLSLKLKNPNKDILARAMLGSTADITQGSGTVTSEAVTALKAGKYVSMAYRNIATAGFTVKDVTDTTTYVLNTDYKVNYRLGMIAILAGGAIAEDDVLHVSYTYNAITGVAIEGGKGRLFTAKLQLDGRNKANGRPCIVDIYKAQLGPNTDIDFFAGDLGTMDFSGSLMLPEGYDHTFKVSYHDV